MTAPKLETLVSPWTPETPETMSPDPMSDEAVNKQLLRIGISPENLDADMRERFREALTLYTTSPDSNLALLEERVGQGFTTEDEKVVELTRWINEHHPDWGTSQGIQWEFEQLWTIFQWGIFSHIQNFFSDTFKNIFSSFSTGNEAQDQAVEWIFWRIFKGIFGFDVSATDETQPEDNKTWEEGIWQERWSETSIETAENLTISPEVIPPHIQWFYNTGLRTILFLGGYEWGNVGESETFLKNYFYTENLALTDMSALEVSESQNETTQEVWESMYEAFEHQRVRDILSVSLSSENLKNIIKPAGMTNTILASKMWIDTESGIQRLEEIYEISQKNGFDYRELPIHEISLLYAFSALWPAAGLSETLAWWVWNSESSINEDEIITALANSTYIDNDLSRAFLETEIAQGWRWLLESSEDARVKELLIEYLQQEQLSQDHPAFQQIEELISYKDFVLEDLIEQDIFQLNEEEKTAIKQGLNYGKITLLYESLHGKKEVWDAQIFSIIALFASILRSQINNEAATEYFWRFSNINSASNVFTDNQIQLISAYTESVSLEAWSLLIDQAFGWARMINGYVQWATGVDSTIVGAGLMGSAVALWSATTTRNFQWQLVPRAWILPSAIRTIARKAWWVWLVLIGLDAITYASEE